MDQLEPTVLDQIGTLMTCDGNGVDPLGLIHNAAMVFDNGKVLWSGPEATLPALYKSLARVHANQKLVTPGLIDCHAHPIFAGNRSDEFARRSRGESYLDIQKGGGGIGATLLPTRQATVSTHVELMMARVNEALSWGTTTMEAKTGYDLTVKGELRLLEIAKIVQSKTPVTIAPTLLGAHLVPPEYKNNRSGFVDAVCTQMIPEAAKQKLCNAVDVYCDANCI